MNRYFLDIRVGCAAIRDRTLTDPEYQGLHPETAGVIKYLSAENVNIKCWHCGQDWQKEYKIDPKKLEELRSECEKLNEI